MRQQDKIVLNETQRHHLHQLIKKGVHKAQVIRNAQLILKSAAGETDEAIAQACQVSKRTVIRTRKRWLQQAEAEVAVEAALGHKPRSGAPVRYGPREQALVIAKACTPPPEGAQRWTLVLLSQQITLQLEEEEAAVTVTPSRETVRRILKKTNSSLTAKSNGASPR